MVKYLRGGLIVILALAIILSCTFVGKKMTDPSTYAHTIEVLDENRTTVLALTAASAAPWTKHSTARAHPRTVSLMYQTPSILW